jgi:hypothetical protein
MDVLLYSKFSPASKQLMLQLQQTPELLESLTITCIDNKLIRKQILSDEKIKIKNCYNILNPLEKINLKQLINIIQSRKNH